MKKISSYKELRIGKIYNSIYTGENEAHAKINGKETFVVTSINPLMTYEIFAQFGSVDTRRLVGTTIKIICPEKTFENRDLYRVENKREYFVKSQFIKLEEALAKEYITIEDIPTTWGQIENYAGKNSKRLFFLSFDVEGKSKDNPYLQKIHIKFKSAKEMKKVLSKYGIILK